MLIVASSVKSMTFSINLFVVFMMKVDETDMHDNVAVMKCLIFKVISSSFKLIDDHKQ